MEHALRDVLDKILNEINYRPRDVNIKAVPSTGENFTTALFTIEVTSPNKDDLKLFAKVGCIGSEIRKAVNADWLYETERYVYKELINIYNEIQDENEIFGENRLVFPKFYGHSAEVGKEIIILENLVENGYKLYNRLKSVSWDIARVSVENLAKFHALSFAFEKKYPEKFNKTIPNMKYRLGNEEQNEDMKPFWIKMVNSAISVIKNPEWRDKIEKFLMDESILKNYNVPIGRPVLCHGDYRLSNILFKGQGVELTAKVLDFQTVHAGCPAADLIYFIFLGSDEKFRAQYYEQLLDHYYRTLEEALGRLAIDSVEAYPREKFDSDMKQLLRNAVLIGVMVLPAVTVEAENAPKLDKDVTDFITEPNELCASRFSGIVNDCFKLGVF